MAVRLADFLLTFQHSLLTNALAVLHGLLQHARQAKQ
jgi:hypothetical protein